MLGQDDLLLLEYKVGSDWHAHTASQDQDVKLLTAIHQIVERYLGIHLSAGVSNVSFGLPQRKLLNQAFMLLLIAQWPGHSHRGPL